jgi:hypothetical protein
LPVVTVGYLAQSITFGREESITITLSPGTYTLSIKYFDAREPQFCDTFFLMIGIAPLSHVPKNLCTGTVLPTVSQFFISPKHASQLSLMIAPLLAA